MSDLAAPDATPSPGFGRWWQLILGVICMTMIANLQYGWTLFVNPIADKYHWQLSSIQVWFTVFVLIETWLVPVEGYLVDKYGPKIIGMIAGILVAASWVINAYADTLAMLYVGAVVGGIGAGAVYGACVGNALKWFPDRRGLRPNIPRARTLTPSIVKATNIVFSRPRWSDTHPKNGLLTPLSTRLVDSANVSAGNVRPNKATGESAIP